MFQLVSKDDMGRRLVFPLIQIKTTMGRDQACDIVLDDEEVSREHTKLYIIDETVQVKDMNSTNGVFLNNKKISKMTRINPGDQLIVGPNMFELEKVEQADKKEVTLTCMLTVEQLRDYAEKSIPERASQMEKGTEEPLGQATMISDHSDLIAGVYQKKIGLAKFPSVEIIFGMDNGMKYLLPMGEYTIGRDKKCNIRLRDDKISVIHGILKSTEKGVSYKDNDSLNGSILNNKNVISSKLHHKDTIMIGGTKIRFLDPAGAEYVSNFNYSDQGKESDRTEYMSNVIELLKEYWYFALGFSILVTLIILIILKY